MLPEELIEQRILFYDRREPGGLSGTTQDQVAPARGGGVRRLAVETLEEDAMEQAPELQGTPAEVAERIAESHARAVAFPKMQFTENAPVGEIAQRMVDGTFDMAFLVSEIERFTRSEERRVGKECRL